MAGKIYLTEEEYRSAVLRRNETRKALSGVFVQLGTALVGGGVVQWYSDEGVLKPIVAGWFLLAIVLILLGLAFLRGLQSES